MQVTLTPKDLDAFEEEIALDFVNKKLPFPIHLSGGNEEQLIDVFRRYVDPGDWVLTTWRSHYHCLLKGVPRVELRAAVLAGKSISLCFPEHKILSSAIVGGTAPIAVGLAMGIERTLGHAVVRVKMQVGAVIPHLLPAPRKVVCFLGDMAAESGIAYESMKYATNHKLPVLWVVEDNGLSTGVSTKELWGDVTHIRDANIVRYSYTPKWPHVGVGQHVQF